MGEGPRRRLRLVITLLIVLVIVVVGQLAQVQILNHQYYRDQGNEQRVQPIAMAEPHRGVIRDRDGHLLVGNLVMYSVEAAPVYVVDARGVAETLGPLLQMPVVEIEDLLRSDAMWVRLKSPVSKEVGERIAARHLPGVTVRPLWTRAYPAGRLASHVLGFCTVDLDGFYGVEGFYDASLRPKEIEWRGPVDPSREQIPWTVVPVVLPQPGADLILTLDRTIQALVEEELARSVYEYQAQGGTIIVMDPRTFEILAMASLPDYNPARYVDFVDQNPLPFADPAISRQYEPGSVFKVLTVAAALDVGLVSPETTYHDRGWIEVGGLVIENADRGAYGEQTVADILIKSLNVGAAWLSVQMGPQVFYRYAVSYTHLTLPTN